MAYESQDGQPEPGEASAHPAQHAVHGSLPANQSRVGTDEEASAAKSEVLQRFWEAVKRLPADVKLAAYLARDPDVPNRAKAILAAGGGYAVSPIDFIPGVIPVAGQLDDVYVLLFAIQQALKRTPNEVAERHMTRAGIRYEDIEGDLQSVRDLVRTAVVKSAVIGGKALGRVSRAAIGIANEQRRRWSTSRAEGSE